MFDLRSDPDCRINAAESLAPVHLGRVRERLMSDAGGEFPRYRGDKKSVKWTDAIGEKPVEAAD